VVITGSLVVQVPANLEGGWVAEDDTNRRCVGDDVAGGEPTRGVRAHAEQFGDVGDDVGVIVGVAESSLGR